MAREITETEFKRLAKAAEKTGDLVGRDGKHGKEFGVRLNGNIVALSQPDENGDYQHFILL